MQQTAPTDKFTLRQQQLSRLDGGLELDGSQRPKLDVTPDEPLGHISAEEERATLEGRPVRNAYRCVPLNGCHNSILPLYRQPHLAFQEFPILDELGCHSRTEADSAVLQSLPAPPPWHAGQDGSVIDAISPRGEDVTREMSKQDAERYLCVPPAGTCGRYMDIITITTAASRASST